MILLSLCYAHAICTSVYVYGASVCIQLLDGILLRIGPNNLYHSMSSKHAFEGDAMLHSFRFDAEANTVSMSSTFLETPKLQIEREYGQGIYSWAVEELFLALNTDRAIADDSLFARAIKIIKLHTSSV